MSNQPTQMDAIDNDLLEAIKASKVKNILKRDASSLTSSDGNDDNVPAKVRKIERTLYHVVFYHDYCKDVSSSVVRTFITMEEAKAFIDQEKREDDEDEKDNGQEYTHFEGDYDHRVKDSNYTRACIQTSTLCL